MIGKCALTAFLATSNPDRAKAFNARTLGLRLVGDDAFALVFDAAGVPLRIQKVSDVRPHPFTSQGWQVRGLRRVITGLSKKGVVFGTSVAWFKDPDGHLLSLSDSGAA